MDISFKYIKPCLKALKVAAVVIITVVVILFSVSLLMQDKVADIILKSLNRNLSTKFEIGSYRLSLLRKFPKASFELKNILVHSSTGFDNKAFKTANTDTLLAARSASIDFKLISLLKGDYTFARITVKSGSIRLYTDSEGNSNYRIASKGEKDRGNGFSIDISRINLVDIGCLYNDLRSPLIIKGRIKSGRIKCRIDGGNIDFESESELLLSYFQLRELNLTGAMPFNIKVDLNKNEKGVFFKKGTLGSGKWNLNLDGYIASDNYLDLKVSGNNIEISELSDYVPAKYRRLLSEYHPTGILKIESTIKGKSSRSVNPHYEVTYSLKDALIDYSKSKLKINKFSIDGYYSNGRQNRAETSVFIIRNFATTLGSASYTGSLNISDFTRPKTELVFRGPLVMAELKEFLNIKNIDEASGSVDLNMKFSGFLEKKDKYRFSDILGLSSQSEMKFNSFGIRLNNKNIDIKDGNGTVIFAEKVSTDELHFFLNKQKITLSGEAADFPGWIAGKPVDLTGSATVSISCLKPELFMAPPSGAVNKEKAEKASLRFPNTIKMDIGFDADTLIYKTFNARKVRGIITYKPGHIFFNTLSMNSQKGTISGSGQVVQNLDMSFITKGTFSVDDVDVNEAFKTFHNFSQNFLKAENIGGSLSGTCTFLLPVDSLLKPDLRSLTAEGKYIIRDGALINFEPLKALSSYIRLSELQNIKFDELDNEFLIRNNFFYLPQMEVRSSAVDLSVNGKHNFDNYYQYHVKMLLSQLLSKKASKSKSVSSEFGDVEDDGLGRTSIFLKIEGKGKEVKVSYDMKAAGDQVRNDIKNEKQTLKTILNEEYGWYDKEAGAAPEQKQISRPRFRISWEGSDTSATEPEAPDERKENIIKNLFKRNN